MPDLVDLRNELNTIENYAEPLRRRHEPRCRELKAEIAKLEYLAALHRERAVFEAYPAHRQSQEPDRLADIDAEIARVTT